MHVIIIFVHIYAYIVFYLSSNFSWFNVNFRLGVLDPKKSCTNLDHDFKTLSLNIFKNLYVS